MSLIWDCYWPLLLTALVIGIVAGRRAFFRPKIDDDESSERKIKARQSYKEKRRKLLLVGLGALLGATALWHWAAGGGERAAAKLHAIAQKDLVYWEMQQDVRAQVARSPLSRDIILTGKADAFQRTELPRVMEQLPGLGDVRWPDQQREGLAVPLVVEAALMAALAFLAGLLLSFLIEIRRRSNAEWSW